MNPDYERLRREAERIYFRFNDKLDDKNAGSGLRNEVRNVVEYFEMGKNPRSIEDYIKRVQQQLRALDSNPTPVMDAGDIDEFIDLYEDLRQEVRKLDNH